MKVSVSKLFRPVDHWKTALMSLPESNFFELLRSVFGNIKTPFNKHKLLEDLFSLLSRPEIRKTIAAYISEQDHKLISAVAIMGEPAPGDLETFFSGEYTSEEIHAQIINLEERLILYRFRDEKILRMALNPVLEEVLGSFTTDTRLLFLSFPKGSNHSKGSGIPAVSAPKESNFLSESAQTEAKPRAAYPMVFIPDCRVLAALFAYILDEEELFKEEAGTEPRANQFRKTQNEVFPAIRKKVLDTAKKIFPALDFELAIRVLIHLGLFSPVGRTLISNTDKVADYSTLSSTERQEYWAAAVYICFRESDALKGGPSWEISPFMSSWTRLRGIASLMHRFRRQIDPEREYPMVTLRRMWELLKKETGETCCLWDSFMEVLEKTGLLEKNGPCWNVPAAAREEESKQDNEAKPVIAMDAASSIVLYPEIPFADAMALGAFCSVKDAAAGPGETTVSLELTRKAVVRGFDLGMDADAMMELLDRLSGGRLDANLGFTLKDWENRYSGVSLHEGIILSLAEDHRYLTDAGPVSRLIRKELAPGIYLLSSDDRSEAVRVLRKAGIDIVAQPPSQTKYRMPGRYGTKVSALSWNYFSRLGGGSASFFPTSGFITEEASRKKSEAAEASAESIKQNFRRVLDKMSVSKQEREELLARIDRRLVMSEAQLEATSLRYEKLEARGLDYVGKSAIAKQAIETSSMVEVTWPAQDGELNRTVGKPQTLEKKGGESVLVLRVNGNSENTARVFRIPLGKISLLRRIKQSIFGE